MWNSYFSHSKNSSENKTEKHAPCDSKPIGATANDNKDKIDDSKLRLNSEEAKGRFTKTQQNRKRLKIDLNITKSKFIEDDKSDEELKNKKSLIEGTTGGSDLIQNFNNLDGERKLKTRSCFEEASMILAFMVL